MANSYPPLIEGLCNPACYPHPVKRVQVLETHISWVLLAGRYAYKIKKPVDLGFLDFSRLEQRRFYCDEEIRLNRRLAPGIYLQTMAIGGSPSRPQWAVEPALEYAVKMRRFASDKLLDSLLTRGLLSPAHIDDLALSMAAFHAGLPAADPGSAYGSPAAIQAPAEQNFQQLQTLLDPDDLPRLRLLQAGSEREFAACSALFARRHQAGYIRECHGDLHLGNIVLLKNRPAPFDGIEFSPALRWIDPLNDAAFLIMDLWHRGRADLAYRFLNGYLEISGDYAGLGVLRFYICYRAAVRAKVAGFRAMQTGAQALKQECREYLDFGLASLRRSRPVLILMHGLPGCGKSAVSQALLEKHQLIRLRSDVERKRLFGLSARDLSGSGLDAGIYRPQASQLTYQHLLQLSRTLLEQGFPVLVDAAFLKREQRQLFQKLAKAAGAGFAIVSIQTAPDKLRQRILRRQASGSDASEADLAVLEKAMLTMEALKADELADTLLLCNDADPLDINDQQAAWDRLAQLLI